MKKAMRAAGCIITVILTIGLLMWTVNLTERKESSNKYSDFFKDRDYDVLFMGTSHVINSVFPMERVRDHFLQLRRNFQLPADDLLGPAERPGLCDSESRCDRLPAPCG